jgi:hypothetical protein
MSNAIHDFHKILNLSDFPSDSPPRFIAAASKLSFTQVATSPDMRSQSTLPRPVGHVTPAVPQTFGPEDTLDAVASGAVRQLLSQHVHLVKKMATLDYSIDRD